MTRLAGCDMPKSGDVPIENDEHYIQTFAVQMLSRRVFKGVYLERRWVEPLKEFRDIVVLHSSGNEELIKDLCIVKKRLRDFYGAKRWIGITDPNCIGAPAGHCLWLKTWNEPLGEHEFCIKKVRFNEKEVYLSVKSNKLMDSKPSAPSDRSQNVEFIPEITEGVSAAEIQENAMRTLKNAYSLLTIHNISSTLSFLLVVLATLFTFLTATIKWLGEFTIRFMHETSNFIHAIMPLLLAIVELIQKTIGGFYLLLAMMWRSKTVGDNPPLPMNPARFGIAPNSPQGQNYSRTKQMSPGQTYYRRPNSQQRHYY